MRTQTAQLLRTVAAAFEAEHEDWPGQRALARALLLALERCMEPTVSPIFEVTAQNWGGCVYLIDMETEGFTFALEECSKHDRTAPGHYLPYVRASVPVFACENHASLSLDSLPRMVPWAANPHLPTRDP